MKKLEKANAEMTEIFKRARTNGDFGPSEFDQDTNDVTRDIIAAFREQHGQCWLGKINLYGDERKHTGEILKQYLGGIVYTFSCSFIAPLYDQTLVDLIHQRDIAPYTGTKKDMARINEISDRIDAIGGQFVHWV